MKETVKKPMKPTGKPLESASSTLYQKNSASPSSGAGKKRLASSPDWRQQITGFFDRNRHIFFIVSMIAGVLMCILLFDTKVSLSGDDSDYLLYADNFWRHFSFPGFRGPLYPVILSPFIGIFGMNLIVLKSLSAIFILLSIWILYKCLQEKIPAIILIPALWLTCICSYLFFYASYTYSEPFFMFVQSIYLFYFFKYFLKDEESSHSFKANWSKYLILGVLALCIGLTRSIGYSIVGVVTLYFAITKRWKDLAGTLIASIVVFCLFQLFKSIVWPDAGSAYDLKNYLAKDYYYPMEMEDLGGFYKRLIANSLIYLSAFLCQFWGVIAETPSNILQVDYVRTILIYLLFFVCMIVVWKRNKILLFIGLYVGIMNFTSFVVLQSTWGQDRLIVIYYPLILVFLLGGIYYLFQHKTLQKFFFIYPLIILIPTFGTLSITSNRIEKNLPVLQENIFGNTLAGLTPDWQNFIKGSQWAAKNLDKNAKIVSRKPSISKVYTGRDFTGVPTDITLPHDSLTTLQSADNHTIVLVNGPYPSPALKYIVISREPFLFKDKSTNVVQIYNVPNVALGEFLQAIQMENLDCIFEYQSFFERLRSVDHRVFDPDVMLNYLINNDIRYLLLPQLRMDPTRNTGRFINNVHLFIWYIPNKYPNRFRSIHIEGKEEPCEIVEVIYS